MADYPPVNCRNCKEPIGCHAPRFSCVCGSFCSPACKAAFHVKQKKAGL